MGRKLKKSIIILGGNCFIARHLLKLINLQKYKVYVIVRKLERLEKCLKGIEYIELEMHQYNTLSTYIKTCDYFIPFTWDGTRRKDRNNREKNESSYRIILDSIIQMIEKCGCEKIILPGTFSEYKNNYHLIDEETVCDTEQEYGKYKSFLYTQALKICEKKDVTMIEARLFSIYGPDDKDEKMLNSVLKKMLLNEDILLTRSEQIWDFVHVDDIARAFLMLIESDIKSGCYNITSNEHRTLKSYFEEMKMVSKSKSELIYGAIPYSSNEIPHVICNSDKIRNAINWEPQITFKEGIQEMIQYYRKEIKQ